MSDIEKADHERTEIFDFWKIYYSDREDGDDLPVFRTSVLSVCVGEMPEICKRENSDRLIY